MKQQTHNTFNEGMVKDTFPLVTPQTVLTDALNGTFITFNGNEFTLQNDMGNTKVERAKLSPGFIPVGMKEYGGIIYVVSFNPETADAEVGSFPSPERDFDSTDFENISPANFDTDDFVISTGTNVNEKTNVIRKLVEPEVLQLNPGDMYVVVYDINDPGSGVGDKITNQTKMDQYISKDVLDRKLFGLKFYKISDDNNLVPLDADDVKVMQDQADLEGEYVYFKENSAGTIAVGLELESMDQFDVNVIDTSRATNANKSIAIEAVGFSDSMAEFQGVRVDIESPTPETFYVGKANGFTGKKVSAKIDQLGASDTVKGTVMPYSAYALYPKLKKDFQIEIGKYASADTGVNNIFRYFYTQNSFKVEFDFKFEGDTADGLHLYAEFYDPWSDYSIVKTIDNPTYYGTNSILMELVDEPTSTTFNSTTKGGTPVNLLMTNPDTTFQKTLLNSTNEIRVNTALRRNHFYILRISGVDKDYSTSPVTYKHYDFYKGVYTNDMFNTVYNDQVTAQPGTPKYVADFNTLTFVKDNIRYTSKINKTKEENVVSSPIIPDTSMMTDGKFYKILTTQVDPSPYIYKSGLKYSNNRSFELDLTLTGTDYIYGQFKEAVLTPSISPLKATDESGPGVAPTLTDVGYTPDPDINPESRADWNATTINSKKYTIDTTVETTRWAMIKVKKDPGAADGKNYATLHKEVPMRDQLYYDEVRQNKSTWNAHRISIARTDGTVSTTEFYCFANGGDLRSKFDSAVGTSPRYGAFISRSDSIERVTCDGTGKTIGINYPSQASYLSDGDGSRMPFNLTVRGGGNEAFYLTKSTDINAIVTFFKNLYAHSAVRLEIFVYYADPSTAKFNGSISTTAKFTGAKINTAYGPIGGVKTYLSTMHFHANNSTTDFSTDVINNYIASRQGTSTIVDGDKNKVRDGFIPFVNTTSTITDEIVLPDVTITQAAQSTVVDAMRNGDSLWKQDPMVAVTSNYNHGQLYSKDDKYQDFVKWFKLANLNTGTEITTSNVWIVTAVSNLAQGNYIDAFRDNKVQRENGAPAILVDIAITSPS